MALNLDHLEALAKEWKNLQPLKPADDERLWQKLRLEWNYHSNHIEGNTLTYGETKALLFHDQTSGTHTVREYEEMKGHDLAIKLVRELAADNRALSQADIRNLNQIVLKEPFYKEAITGDGKPSRKLITPGRYKEEPNSVRTSTGELFEYAAPLEVPERMAKLTEAIRSASHKEGLEFIAALAIIHHEFTLIHPFDDGNGRVARLLTNYILLKKGLPPLVIQSDKKTTYLAALRQADGDNPTELTGFFKDQLIWSLEFGVKAAKGESLEEASDIEKEIALFVREQKDQEKQILRKSPDVVRQCLIESIQPLFERLDLKTQKIGELFQSRELSFSFSGHLAGIQSWPAFLSSLNTLQFELWPSQIARILLLKGYKGSSPRPFSTHFAITIALEDYEYQISMNGQTIHHAIYAEKLTTDAIDTITGTFLKQLLQAVKQLSQ